MSGTTPTTGSSDSDTMALLAVGAVALGSAGTVAALAWSKVLAWCLQHQVLLPALADPVLVVPGTNGAGFDTSRVAVGVAVVVIVLAVAAAAARKKMRADGDLR